MNHHARLVLFLRNQNVITELEADEYLNPATARAGRRRRWPSTTCRRAARCAAAWRSRGSSSAWWR